MSRARRLPVVTVLLAGAGCHREPASPPPTPPVTTANPPLPMSPAPPIAPRSASALPTWDEVESGHPPGATNPPLPMLALSADGEHCYKEWLSPMRPTDQLVEAIKIGGRVLAEGEQSTGTEVQCPDNAEAVRARAAAATPEGG